MSKFFLFKFVWSPNPIWHKTNFFELNNQTTDLSDPIDMFKKEGKYKRKEEEDGVDGKMIFKGIF